MVPDPQGAEASDKKPAVTFQAIPGSAIPQVTLTARAAERLGIETSVVVEQSVVDTQMVGGLIVLPTAALQEERHTGGTFGGFGAAGTVSASQPPSSERTPSGAGEVWVQVTLSPGEWTRLDKDKPARILPLQTRDGFPKEVYAQPSGMPPREDKKRSMLSLYYVLLGDEKGPAVNSRGRVELKMTGGEEKRKTVPYSAVYYDAKGNGWVYVSPKPLTYERRPIVIDRIRGDIAVLSEGPPVGTPIVTVGAALLYGAEIFGK